MNRWRNLLLVTVVFSGIAFPSLAVTSTLPPLNDQPDFKQVIFYECLSGDTCIFTIPGLPDVFGKRIRVRLAGIHAPDLDGACGFEREAAAYSREVLNLFLKGKIDIQLYNVERGERFELIARIKSGDVDLSRYMIEAELAVPYGTDPSKSWCPDLRT